jgi:hypothetical protein
MHLIQKLTRKLKGHVKQSLLLLKVIQDPLPKTFADDPIRFEKQILASASFFELSSFRYFELFYVREIVECT